MRKSTASFPSRELISSRFSAYNMDMSFPEHTHNYFEIVITYEANFLHTINGRTVSPKVGDTVIFRPGDYHSATPTSATGHRVRDIYVSTAMFNGICTNLDSTLPETIDSAPEPPIFNLSEKYISDLEKRIDSPFFSDTLTPRPGDDKFLNIIKKGIVTDLLGQYIYNCYKDERLLPDCLVNLIKNLHNPDFHDSSIEDITQAMGYSHTYICRVFREYFGKTIQSYLIEEKVDRSIALLQTDMSVEQIAHKLGWKKPDNYISAFKRVYNTTPGQFRIEARKNNNKYH